MNLRDLLRSPIPRHELLRSDATCRIAPAWQAIVARRVDWITRNLFERTRG